MTTEYSLYIDQGVTFSTDITITDNTGNPVDLSHATLASQVRKSYTSSTAYPFTITIVDAVNGEVILSMSAAQTAMMAGGRYVYDARYTMSDGTVILFLKGIVTVSPTVTQ